MRRDGVYEDGRDLGPYPHADFVIESADCSSRIGRL